MTLRFERVSDRKPLCFRHAVQQAHADIDIQVEVEEHAGSEHDMRQQHCQACAEHGNKTTGTIRGFEERMRRLDDLSALRIL